MNNRKKYLAVVNPISGTSSKDEILPYLAEEYSHNNERLYICFSQKENDAALLAKEAVCNNFEAVIAVGGDGTINEIAKELYNTPVKLGIIPKGSGNGLARALGIPLNDTQKAAEIIHRAHVSALDTSFANGLPFFCTVGVGFDAAITKRYAEATRRGIFSYVKSVVEEYITYDSEQYQITADGNTFECKAMLITCANINQYGSNTYIAPGAKPNDGLLDLVILSPVSPLQAPQLAVQLFTKKVEKNTLIESLQCKEITIKRKHDGLVQLDGETLSMGSSIQISIAPQSLQVYTPPQFTE